MTNTETPLPVAEIADGIRVAAKAGKIADPENLADDRVWLFRGTRDSKVSALVHWAAADLYAEFVPADRIHRVDDIDADHVFPAKGRGNDCGEVVRPYVGDCDYDAAGELLGFLYPGLAEPSSGEVGELLEVELRGAAEANLMETAYLYVPSACAGGAQACALHLVLHGCDQSVEAVGTEFIELSGYLPWAEANGIVLAFPQVRKSMALPMNPHGCWDWWGYTDENYAGRTRRQQTAQVVDSAPRWRAASPRKVPGWLSSIFGPRCSTTWFRALQQTNKTCWYRRAMSARRARSTTPLRGLPNTSAGWTCSSATLVLHAMH